MQFDCGPKCAMKCAFRVSVSEPGGSVEVVLRCVQEAHRQTLERAIEYRGGVPISEC